MPFYIHHQKDWPNFTWDSGRLLPKLAHVRNQQGNLLGKMAALGFDLKAEAFLETIQADVLKSSEIEGAIFDPEKVRSSVARYLGMDIGGLVPSDRNVDGMVEMELDATRNFHQPLTVERLFDWHAALFPTGRSGMFKIRIAAWRNDENGPMQIVSGAIGMERVHFQAPDAANLDDEMRLFLDWFNAEQAIDPVLKAGIAHFWFVTIHPFDDGNGRIGRAIMDLQLSKSEQNPQRFYSLSAQITAQRKGYYAILEKTSNGNLDITDWLFWFLECMEAALTTAGFRVEKVLAKAHFWEKHAKTVLNQRQIFMLNQFLTDFVGKLNSTKYAKMAKCSQDTASRDLQDLVAKQVLEKDIAGSKNTNYLIFGGLK